MKLYALGSNGSAQLGLNHTDDVSSPQQCSFHEAPPDLEQCCPPGVDAAASAAAGGDDDEVVKVVAGGNHTLLFCRSGAVFAAGSNERGQCGLPKKKSSGVGGGQVGEFTRVCLTSRAGTGEAVGLFDDVAATWEASFFVKGSTVYVRGCGSRGELGLGEGIVEADEDDDDDDDDDGGNGYIDLAAVLGKEVTVGAIRACMSHVVMLTEAGDVLGWGAGRKGQLGIDARAEKIVWSPRVLITGGPGQAAKIAVGRDFTFVAGEKDRWHAFLGDRAYENNYLSDLAPLSITRELDARQGYDLHASWSNIYALSSEGRLRGWGRNERGQLPPQSLPALAAVAAGSEHCVALTAGGQVLAWGWGEHGNCGPDTDKRTNVAGRWNVLPVTLEEGEKVSGVGAGCATSFIVVVSSK